MRVASRDKAAGAVAAARPTALPPLENDPGRAGGLSPDRPLVGSFQSSSLRSGLKLSFHNFHPRRPGRTASWSREQLLHSRRLCLRLTRWQKEPGAPILDKLRQSPHIARQHRYSRCVCFQHNPRLSLIPDRWEQQGPARWSRKERD